MKYSLLKRSIAFLFVCLLSITFYTPVNACTTFSVKTEKNIYYGKNWDYYAGSEKNVTIHLEQMPGSTLSCLVFRIDGFHSSSINSDGFFASCNDVYNITPGDCTIGPDTIDITSLRYGSTYFRNINELENYIKDKTVLCYVYPEHIFYADKSGRSCVLETDNQNHHIIESDDNFLVATNFPLYTLNSLSDTSKCSRYKAAYKNIENNINKDFGLDEVVKTLRLSSQGLTIYSFAYDANENAVYLYLDRDFNRVWKFSFASNTLSTYQGFKNDKEFKLDEEGIALMDLINYQKENKATPKPIDTTPTPSPTPLPTPDTAPSSTPGESDPGNSVENPETGESSPLMLWGMLIVSVSLFATCLRPVFYRKKNQSDS